MQTASANQNVLDYEKKVAQWQFEGIFEAFDKISRWVDKDFPEVKFTVEFNDDSGNPADPSFKIKSRIFTDKTMDRNDQLLKKHEIVIRKEVWEDAFLMQQFIAKLEPMFKQSIASQVNSWYNKKKEEGTTY